MKRHLQLCILLMFLTTAVDAQGFLFWAEQTGSQKISRIRSNGTEQTTLLSSFASDIEIDMVGERIYYISANSIRAANLDGSNDNQILGTSSFLDTPSGLAIDMTNGKVYWSDEDLGGVNRANTDGTTIQDVLISLSEPSGIAIDRSNGFVYVANSAQRTIIKAFIDETTISGGDVIFGNAIISVPSDKKPIGIALDVAGGKIYWTESPNFFVNTAATGRIRRANLDGSNPETLVNFSAFVFILDLAIDKKGGKLYWSEYNLSSLTGKIGRVSLNGTNPETFLNGLNGPYGLSFCPTLPFTLNLDKGTSICFGEQVTFTCNVAETANNISYQWKINDQTVGTNANAFTSTAIQDGDKVSVTVRGEDNCPDSKELLIEVNPNLTPAVFVTTSSNTTLCSSESITFIASAVNPGFTPAYQWFKNGILVTDNNNADPARYTLSSPQDDDQIYVKLQSSVDCPSSEFVDSGPINLTVLQELLPQVNITANYTSPVCNNTSVTFTATSFASGDSPQYKWYLNNNLFTTTNIPTLTTTSLSSNALNEIYVVLKSNYACALDDEVSSATLSLQTVANEAPFVGLQALNGTVICQNELVSFKANPVSGGLNPQYQWFVNGVPQGSITSNDIFQTFTLKNGDVVSVSLISSLSCAIPQVTNSSPLVMQVNPAPFVGIISDIGNFLCDNFTVTFTAIPSNAGTNPTFQWRKDGQNIIGATSISLTQTDNDLTDESNIDVVMTTNTNCDVPIVTSNPINIQVANNIIPIVSIRSLQGFPICTGSDAIFGIDQSNLSDPNATYVWKVNGNPVANSNVAVFNAGVLQNGATVQLQYTTILSCANPKTVNSNTLTVNTQPLIAPNNLSVTASGTNRIDISWNDNSSNETGFRIERSIGNDNNFQFLTTKGSNETFHSDQNVTAGTLYFYRVRALNGNISGCVSAYTSAVGAATDDGEIITALPKDRENGFKVFPNPSQSGIFQLHWLTEVAGKVNIAVFNLMNAKVFDANFVKSSLDKTTSIDLSNQSAGMYYLKVSYQDRQYFVRVVRE